jgi:hypothetical protein
MARELPTIEEARAMPTFWRVLRVNRSDYTCEDCREHAREPWIDGSACDAHTIEEVAPALTVNHRARTYRATRPSPDAYLALEVLRAGGNPEPRYTDGIGAAQWSYKRPRKAADRDALVLTLTREPLAPTAAAAA